MGSRGSVVAQMQLALNQLADRGVFALPAGRLAGTGIFGENTETTVKAFQKKLGLEVDGVAGPQTLGKIDDLRLAPAPAAPVLSPSVQTNLVASLLGIAQGEVGTREVGGNNNGARIREYQRSTDLAPDSWPWCAAFVCWVIREWLVQPEPRRALGWKNEETDAKRPKTAAAFSFLDWARRQDQFVLPPTADPQPGMIAVYSFSHIGFVKEVLSGGKFRAIEGNTNGAGDRDSTTGDGVWEKVRTKSLVRNFISWRFVHAIGGGDFVGNASPQPTSTILPNVAGIGAIPREVLEFIIDEEGMDQPWKFPGGSSGVSLGHGFDLGAESRAELLEDWGPWLSGSELDRLSRAIGRSGPEAAALCPDFRDINVSVESADDVFFRHTVPKYYGQMLGAFPNADKLPGKAQGALLSLVFNRGTSMKGDRREEMREIRDLLAGNPPYDLAAIAASLRKMKKLWENQGLDGLVVRREREARWVEEAA